MEARVTAMRCTRPCTSAVRGRPSSQSNCARTMACTLCAWALKALMPRGLAALFSAPRPAFVSISPEEVREAPHEDLGAGARCLGLRGRDGAEPGVCGVCCSDVTPGLCKRVCPPRRFSALRGRSSGGACTCGLPAAPHVPPAPLSATTWRRENEPLPAVVLRSLLFCFTGDGLASNCLMSVSAMLHSSLGPRFGAACTLTMNPASCNAT
mmetsp:Transcript_34673/g.79420  ORF Transcript_34673/g.79420 Transcript_34673/m.79420 type:complete len:210 (+) Transcript_34673:2091-2720(+)